MKSIWTGYLKVNCLTIPVKVYNSTSAKAIRFDTLHSVCRTRIHQENICPHCNKAVPKNEIVLGYLYGKDRYVVLSEADFCKAQKEPAGTIDIHGFVDDGVIDPVLYSDSYYLVPANSSAREAFVVLRDALALTKKIAIAKVVVGNREHLYALKAYHGVLIAFALHYSGEIVDVHKLDGTKGLVAMTADPQALSLAKLLVEQRGTRFTPAQYRDDYAESLYRLIRAKAKGKEYAVEQHAGPEKVTSVMDALERSLKRAPGKKPVKAAK
jgi:DNA end-binding protein Ku